jgi:multidrug efflux pump subunit AcrB
VVVFAPLAFLTGVVGTFFASLALALTSAVLASLVVALSSIPLLAMRWLRAHGSGPLERERLANAYAGLLVRSLGRRRAVALMGLVLLVAGALAASALETDFVPELDEGSYVLDYFTPIGTSLKEADALAETIDDMLRADPDVESWNRRLGAEVGPPRATETSRGDYIVRLKKDRSRSVFEIMEDQRKILAGALPGVRVELIQILADMLGDLEGNPEPIELKIFGEDERELRRQAKRVADAIKDVPGLADLFDGQVACSPERAVRIDPLRAGRAGLTTQEIARQISALLLGSEVAPVPEHDRLVPVRVRWPDAARFSEGALERLRIKTAAGTWVPLVELGRIEDDCVASEINRENLRLMVPVTARLSEGQSLGSAVAEVEARLSKLTLPRGYSLEVGGLRLSQEASFRELGLALGAALALVLVVLVFQFGSFDAPLAILAAMPIALAGGAGALLATRTPLNVSSLLGGILLVGLVVKNGILFLDRSRQREAEGLPLDEALADAGRVRLRPILMTTLCTVVGLIPLALGLGSGAEMHRPLAICVLGGLVLSTLGTLFLVPAVYRWLRR